MIERSQLLLVFYFVSLLSPDFLKGKTIDLRMDEFHDCDEKMYQVALIDKKMENRLCKLTESSASCGLFVFGERIHVKSVSLPNSNFGSNGEVLFLRMNNMSNKYCNDDFICDGPADFIMFMWFKPVHFCGIQVHYDPDLSDALRTEKIDISFRKLYSCFNHDNKVGGLIGRTDGRECLQTYPSADFETECSHFIFRKTAYVKNIKFYLSGHIDKNILVFLKLKNSSSKFCEKSIKKSDTTFFCEGPADIIMLWWIGEINLCVLQLRLDLSYVPPSTTTPAVITTSPKKKTSIKKENKFDVKLYKVETCLENTRISVTPACIESKSPGCVQFPLENLYYVLSIDVSYIYGRVSRLTLFDDRGGRIRCTSKNCEGLAERIELQWYSEGAKICKITVTVGQAPINEKVVGRMHIFQGNRIYFLSVPLLIASFAILISTVIALYRFKNRYGSLTEPAEDTIASPQEETNLQETQPTKTKKSVVSFQNPFKDRLEAELPDTFHKKSLDPIQGNLDGKKKESGVKKKLKNKKK